MKNIEWSQSSSSAACALILCLVKFFGNVKRNHISKRISHEAERIVVWQHWLIRLIRQPFQTDCKNIRKRTKKWENESSGRVVISFGVTANKSQIKWVMSTYETQEPVPVPKTVQTESSDRLHYCCRKKRLEHYQAFVKRNLWEQSPLDFTAGSLVCFRHCFRVNMQEMSLQYDDVFVRGRLYSLIGQLTQEVRAWRPVFATHYHRFTA